MLPVHLLGTLFQNNINIQPFEQQRYTDNSNKLLNGFLIKNFFKMSMLTRLIKQPSVKDKNLTSLTNWNLSFD